MSNRKFSGSISVRIDTRRVKLELSPALLHGGPEGEYRVRVDRRWVMEDSSPRFFDREALAALVAETALATLPEPSPVPDIPFPSRVIVRTWKEEIPYFEGAWTNTPPIRDYSGKWVVSVSLGGKRIFVPVEDVTITGGCHGKR